MESARFGQFTSECLLVGTDPNGANLSNLQFISDL
jgi:hypothetical protein